MKYLRTFEGFTVDLNDIKISEMDAVGRYKEPSVGKTMYCMYNGSDVAHVTYHIFKDLLHTRELRGIFDSELYIEFIKTETDYIKNGIAGMLLNKLIETAKAQNIDVITLRYEMWTLGDPEWLKKYYEKFGFKLLVANKMYLPLKEKSNLPIA